MGSAAGPKLVAALLLALFLLGVGVLIADWYVGAAYRHVVADVSNVDGTARIDVNCRRALKVDADEGSPSVDLGYLDPEDRIYLSVYNERGAAAWGVQVDNGQVVRDFSNGHAGVTGRGTGPYGIAMAQLVTADGDRIGTVGCALPGLVSDSLANYQQAPEMRAMLNRHEAPLPWDPPRFPFALIEGLADLVPLLALLGFVAAASIARVRSLIDRHRVISFTVGALNLFLGLTKSVGWEVLLIWFNYVGLTLLLVSAVVTAWPHTGSRCLTSCSTPDPKPNPE
jgi:hypothetical protein